MISLAVEIYLILRIRTSRDISVGKDIIPEQKEWLKLEGLIPYVSHEYLECN